MKFLKKYILLIFLIENLLALSPLIGVSQLLFYAMLAIGLFLMAVGGFFRPENFRRCRPLYLLGLVYIFYQFTLGVDTISVSTITYLIAKVATFVIITVSIVDDWNLYARKVPFYLSIFIFFILLMGINNVDTLDTTDRQVLGFGNTNATSALAALCLATVIFFWNRRYAFFYSIMAIFALYAMLAAGGRNAMMVLAIMLLVWTGMSMKRIRIAGAVLCLVWLIISVLPIHLAGIERLEATISGEAGTNRDIERLATQIMIDEKPYTGWGFGAENVGEAAQLTELGSHNGYLDTIKFMGYPFGGLWILVLVCSVLPLIKYIKSSDRIIRYHLAIVLSTLASAFFEAWFVGVHQVYTNIFFCSLAILTSYKVMQESGQCQELRCR